MTINVYFPAAEAKEAAKEFVEKVIGDEAKPAQPNSPTHGGGGGMAAPDARFDPLMLVGIGTAYAQGAPDITIKTPAIQAIQARMESRFDAQPARGLRFRRAGLHRRRPVVVRDASKLR